MAEVESAAAFTKAVLEMAELVRHPGGTALPFCSKREMVVLIASRDTAIREALLDELEITMDKHYASGYSEGLAFRCALGDMRTKYAAPASGGENG
jgi:hypothetical protein